MPTTNGTGPQVVDRTTALGPQFGMGGPRRYGGYVREEWLPELFGILWERNVREMLDQDPIVGASLLAYGNLMRKVTWTARPADDSSEAARIAEEFEGGLHDLEDDWESTLSEILSFLPWGWSALEWSCKLRRGDNRDPKLRSRFNDGRIGFRSWDLRPQETRLKWDFDDDGRATALWQRVVPGMPKTGNTWIPLEKCLHFRTVSRKGNPEGVSILRNAWRSWRRKREIENIEGVGAERDLVGMLRVWMPPEYLAPDAPPPLKAVRSSVEEMARNVRRNEQDYLLLPALYDQAGHKLFDADLMTTGGTRQFDLGGIIDREDKHIALSMMIDIILLGHENVGSLALHRGKESMLSAGLTSWLDSIGSVITNQVWPELMRLNGYPSNLCPSLTHGDVEVVDLIELGTYIASLAKAGAPLFGSEDDKLFSVLLSKAGLPRPAGMQDT